jgi:hypothetical protein
MKPPVAVHVDCEFAGDQRVGGLNGLSSTQANEAGGS